MGKRDAAFEYGGQWLDRERDDGPWYRYWADGRRVRRRSLATRDLNEAKHLLVEAVAKAPHAAGDPDQVMMGAVFRHYLDTKMVPRREHPDKPSRSETEARRALRRAAAFMVERSPRKSEFTVAEFDVVQQKAFARKLYAEGLSPKSIATLLSFVAAAINYGATDQAVETPTGERSVRLLRYAPTVNANEKEIAKTVGGSVSRQRQFIPTVGECAEVIDLIKQEHLFRYFIVALCTWARPSTVLELDVETQVDFRYGLVDLLPPNRLQNAKRRPQIPLVPTLEGWLRHWGARHPIMWNGAPIREINDAFRSLVRPIGLAEFTPYTLRHFVNSEAIARGAAGEDRSRMLGHLPKTQSATTAWYEHSRVAGYLRSAVEATESLLDDLESLCGRPLRAPKPPAEPRLRIVGI